MKMRFNPDANQSRPASSCYGLTLLELLVALILSVLLMAMLMPLLATVTRPSKRLDIAPEPAWSRALGADFRELVSPLKCAEPVVQMVPGSAADPMPQLILQSFCRVGSESGQVPLRGPNEVRYRLEPVEVNGPLALVRYAQGWHDPLSSRLVVADHLTAWNITEQWEAPATGPGGTAATRPSDEVPIAFDIQLVRMGSTESASFWIPRVGTAAADVGDEPSTDSDDPNSTVSDGASRGKNNSARRSGASSGGRRRSPGGQPGAVRQGVGKVGIGGGPP